MAASCFAIYAICQQQAAFLMCSQVWSQVELVPALISTDFIQNLVRTKIPN